MEDSRVKLGPDSGCFGASLTGKRERDEDFIAGFRIKSILDWDCQVSVLCDGMGGGERGEDASEMAANIFLDNIRDALGTKPIKRSFFKRKRKNVHEKISSCEVFSTWESRNEYWEKIAIECHEGVRALSTGGKVGTTFTALVMAQAKAGDILWCDLIHIGDTRCYRLAKKSSDCELLSQDHSLTGDMFRAGYIQLYEIPDTHGHNVLQKSIGMDDLPLPDVTSVEVKRGDQFLLCCDGVWGSLHREKGLWQPSSKLKPQKRVEAWVTKALEQGSTDNCSASLFIT